LILLVSSPEKTEGGWYEQNNHSPSERLRGGCERRIWGLNF
jgi:hypothetical protein